MNHTADNHPFLLCSWELFYRPSDLTPEDGFRNNFEPPALIRVDREAEEAVEVSIEVPDSAIFVWDRPQQSACPTPQLPTPAECATHLLLLQAFLQLRVRVLCSTALDAALGIVPHEYTSVVYPKVPCVRDPTFPLRREEKWTLFLTLAVSRFMAWAQALDAEALAGKSPDDRAELPPLDVLIVWHALMVESNSGELVTLTSKNFSHLQKVELPWEKIYKSIDTEDYVFTITPEAARRFTRLTGMSADLLDFLTSQEKQSTKLAIGLRMYGKPGSATDPKRHRGLTMDDFKGADASASRLDKGFLRVIRDVLDKHRDSHKIMVKTLAALRRQTAFIDTMDYTLWIASPALLGTLQRGIRRYERFLKLFAVHDPLRDPPQRSKLIPTLDVDLVWQTHLCSSPTRYVGDCQSLAGRFIQHASPGRYDPNSGWQSLYQQTSKLYYVRYGSDYGICLCWECEALRSAIEGEDDGGPLRDLDDRKIAQEVAAQTARNREAERKKRAAWPLLS